MRTIDPKESKIFIWNHMNEVRQGFDRIKKGTPYKNCSITDFVDQGGFALVFRVEVENKTRRKSKSVSPSAAYALRICEEDIIRANREINAVRILMLQGQKHIVEYLMMFSLTVNGRVLRCTLMNFYMPMSMIPSSCDNIEIAVRCGSDLLPLLQVCFRNSILHRDIKPSNIMYDRDFRNHSGFMLGDFGEARIDQIGTVTPVGSFFTISPEILGLDPDISHDHQLCDMYSLGIVMYYYLNDRRYPFCNGDRGHNDVAYHPRLTYKKALPPPQYGSERLKALVVKATQYYPKDRFQSPQEMLDELKKCDEYRNYISFPTVSDEITVMPVKNRSHLKMPVKIRSHLKPGQTLSLGKFPQTANGIIKPLVWRVLDVKDGKALLISDKLIICKEYNEIAENVTWANCSLRRWLNEDFLQKAFGTFRPEEVAPATNINADNPSYHTTGGDNTNDMVFILSIDEVNRYFPSDEKRKAQPTDFLHRLYDNKDSSRWWWLRTPGDFGNFAACVNDAGSVRELGRSVIEKDIAVRPALWIHL